MNSDVENFFKKNGINPMELVKNSTGIIQKPDDVNYIVSQYGFRKTKEIKKISIADIVGYDYEWRGIDPRIAYSLDAFFNSQGDGYHSRSIRLLDYTSENVMDKINFEKEKIIVDDMADNKYVISSNGLHRYTVLRVLYLNECLNVNGNREQLAKLKEKYTIPVISNGVDLFKTYSKFILMSFPCGVKDVEEEYNRDNWKYTGRLLIKKNNREQIVIETDQDFFKFVRGKASIINANINDLQDYYDKYPSFRRVLEDYYSKDLNVDSLMKRQNKGGIEQC